MATITYTNSFLSTARFESGNVRTESIATSGTYQLRWDDSTNGPTLQAGETAELFENGASQGTVTFQGTISGTGAAVVDTGSGGFAPLLVLDSVALPFLSNQAFDSAGGVTCFLPGTRIAAPTGMVAVEALRPDDLVLTADGRAVPVRWLGRQTVATYFIQESRRPVTIAAGALAEGVPARELRVTSDHALLLDGVLVNAGALVNGTSIRRMTPAELGERFTVFHIETETHEVILAEGTPAETFLDTAARRRFDNHAEHAALHGEDPAPMAERPEPRVLSERQLPPALRARIAARAAALAGPSAVAERAA